MRVLIIAWHTLLGKALRQGLEEEGMVVDVVPSHEVGLEKMHGDGPSYEVVVVDSTYPDTCSFLEIWRQEGILTPTFVLAPPCECSRDLRDAKDKNVMVVNKPFEFYDLVNQLRNAVS